MPGSRTTRGRERSTTIAIDTMESLGGMRVDEPFVVRGARWRMSGMEATAGRSRIA